MVGAPLGERLELLGGRVGAVFDAVHESHPATDATVQRDGRRGVLHGFGGDGLAARGQLVAQLLVRLIDQAAHAAVGGETRAVTLARSGGTDPVEVAAFRCGRGDAGRHGDHRTACQSGGQDGRSKTVHEESSNPGDSSVSGALPH